MSEKKQRLVIKFMEGLKKSREDIREKVDTVLAFIDKSNTKMLDELEEVLIAADVGADTSFKIIRILTERISKDKGISGERVKEELKSVIKEMLHYRTTESISQHDKPTVILMVGVNGVGKTTSVGKLASLYNREGEKVLIAAADTFRAAAIEQLEIWAQKADAGIVKHKEGSDPAAVVFDTLSAAKARGATVVICDTAGRLHNKKNLMEELKKIQRIIDSNAEYFIRKTYLVLDATTGQNGLVQAKMFQDITNVDGIVLTKLDGSAKGGIVIAIRNELDIPVKYVGLGEGVEDLEPFDSDMFVDAFLG